MNVNNNVQLERGERVTECISLKFREYFWGVFSSFFYFYCYLLSFFFAIVFGRADFEKAIKSQPHKSRVFYVDLIANSRLPRNVAC